MLSLKSSRGSTFSTQKWVGFSVLAAALSLVVLDGTIVGVSLPTIIDALHLSLTDAQWVNSLYSVVFAALLLAVGRAGDRVGRKRILIVGVVVFVLGSTLAGVASDAATLIAARAVQGVGGAMVLPSTLSTVNATFRGKDRVVAFGIWGASMAGMAAVGPLLGAWITSTISWRWIFFVNLPLGLIIVAAAFWFVPESRGTIDEPGLDVVGVVLSALGFGGVVFALIEGSALGWWRAKGALRWGDWSLVPLIGALGLLGVFAFVVWEARRLHGGQSALLRLDAFAIPSFAWGNLAAAAVAAGEFGLVFIVPLFLINGLGVSIMTAGWVLAAMALGAFISGALARRLAAWLTAPGVVVVGLVLELVGVGGLAVIVGSGGGVLLTSGLLVIYGLGLGLAAAQLTSTILAKVPAQHSGSASATQSTFRQLGSAIGAASTGTALAVAITSTLETQLSALPHQQRVGIIAAVRDSAGGVLPALRQHPLPGVDLTATTDAFASACSTSIWVAFGFLICGFLGALVVFVDSRTVSLN